MGSVTAFLVSHCFQFNTEEDWGLAVVPVDHPCVCDGSLLSSSSVLAPCWTQTSQCRRVQYCCLLVLREGEFSPFLWGLLSSFRLGFSVYLGSFGPSSLKFDGNCQFKLPWSSVQVLISNQHQTQKLICKTGECSV